MLTTNGSGKAVPKGTFDRPRKRSVRGLGQRPNKRIGNGKGYPDDLLAGSKQNTFQKLGIRCPAFLLQSSPLTVIAHCGCLVYCPRR